MSTDTGPVAEIVTYRLKEGVDIATHVRHATGTRAGLAAHPGFLRRHLSRDDTGLWTDHVEWASLGQAQQAADAVMQIPGFAAFAGDIDMASLAMRHAALHLTMAP